MTLHPKDSVEPGSPEWIAAVQDFQRDHGYAPWQVVSEDGWCVSRFPEGPGVAWTAAGIRELRQMTLNKPGAFRFWGGLINDLNSKETE